MLLQMEQEKKRINIDFTYNVQFPQSNSLFQFDSLLVETFISLFDRIKCSEVIETDSLNIIVLDNIFSTVFIYFFIFRPHSNLSIIFLDLFPIRALNYIYYL